MLTNGRLYLGHLGPIPLFVHWSALLLVGLAWMWAPPSPAGFLILLTVLVSSIVLHEFGHGIVGKWFGAQGVTITIWAMGGVCSSQRTLKPGRELLILAAGPLVNILLVALCLGLSFGLQYWNPPWFTGQTAIWIKLWLHYGLVVNFGLALFNILPLYPLDGGQMAFNGLLLITRRVRLSALITFGLAVLTAIVWLGWNHLNGGIATWTLVITLLLLHNAWGLVSIARD